MNMKKSAYYKELQKYVSQYHPVLKHDDDFLRARSELAEQTFIRCSHDGLNTEECKHEADIVLYAGLHFSVYELVEDIVSDEFKNLNFSDVEKFVDQMYLMLQPVFSKYEINDDFERSSEYDNLYSEIVGSINEYVKKNELV